MKRAGIAGAGLVGRLLALSLLKNNWHITLFDKDIKKGRASCGIVAGGMLAPFAEIETTESIIFELGMKSISLWPRILADLPSYTYFQTKGSIAVAHQSDLPELERFVSTLVKKIPKLASELKFLNSKDLNKIEPELNFSQGILLPFEGNIDNYQLFLNLEYTLMKQGVIWHEATTVNQVTSGQIIASGTDYNFDMVFDCRGLGAKDSLPNLRGVRGELFILHAPQVNFNRPIRMMHPRYNIYLVPRLNNIFVIGASEIESNDMSAMSVQSSLELLSSTYSLHKGFAEARIIEMLVNCRPAFPDNLPKIYFKNHLVRINGLYRHGYLLAPALVEEVMLLLDGKSCYYESIICRE